MRFGFQLFGYLYSTKGDILSELRALRDMGFSFIEPCVSIDPIPGFECPIWTAQWLLENIGAIRDMGLDMCSCHVFDDDIASHADLWRQVREATGIRHFIVKSPAELTDVGLQQAAINYMRAADALAEFGGELLVHNEHQDISTHIHGVTAYERLLDLCQGKLFMQVDVGWVWYGGEDPAALLKRNAYRVHSVHYKDFGAMGDPADQTPIGYGAMDSAVCFRFARAHGLPQIIDQDMFPRDHAGDLKKGISFLQNLSGERPNTVSYLNIMDADTGRATVLKRFDGVIEAPNWVQGEEALLYNAEGRLHRYDITSGEDTVIDLGDIDNINNDHVLSPDGKQVAVSHMTFGDGFTSRIYTAPIDGGAPALVTPESPSFLHGWSPDGATLAYCAFRQIGGERQVDVYTIPAAGGEEKRLTDGGFNDGPEFAPDGSIWYNSTKSGLMQVWRMNIDGTAQTQMTFNDRNNWFPHVSPDGNRLVYISYRKDDLEPAEHLPNMQVELWRMNADGTEQTKLASIFGGQGSMNVNSWAADSKRFAFVSYESEE